MDFTCPIYETAVVPYLHLSTLQTFRRSARTILLTALAPALAASGCDRVKQVIKDSEARGQADGGWQRDSALLASEPTLLFRVTRTERGTLVVPLARIGDRGFRRVSMEGRGWRALDVKYLHAENAIDALRDGRVSGTIRMSRGMWEASGVLDSLPGCRSYVPAGLAQGTPDAALAVIGVRPQLPPTQGLSDGELNHALSTVPTLVAPASGVATSQLARYRRTVHVLNTGVNNKPTILIEFNDPEQVSDTLQPVAQRPRQLIVALDKGVFGYKPSYRYATLGNAKSPPRLRFLDYIDVDNDGKAELFFAFTYRAQRQDLEGVTYARFQSEEWKEEIRQGLRCPR
jgi:hypothetical protein